MKALILSICLLFSTASFANEIGAYLKTHPVVDGVVKGVEKTYKMNCEHPSNINVTSQGYETKISADILCLNSEMVDGVQLESSVTIQIKATMDIFGIYFENISFHYAG